MKRTHLTGLGIDPVYVFPCHLNVHFSCQLTYDEYIDDFCPRSHDYKPKQQQQKHINILLLCNNHRILLFQYDCLYFYF